mmetsp:Transcript_1392/g.4582  ORF Transcript_1392/g.4582 Transcript_1392/m.4582 type:complete len:216 (+) Transcript_1392:559-1206(+)
MAAPARYSAGQWSAAVDARDRAARLERGAEELSGVGATAGGFLVARTPVERVRARICLAHAERLAPPVYDVRADDELGGAGADRLAVVQRGLVEDERAARDGRDDVCDGVGTRDQPPVGQPLRRVALLAEQHARRAAARAVVQVDDHREEGARVKVKLSLAVNVRGEMAARRVPREEQVLVQPDRIPYALQVGLEARRARTDLNRAAGVRRHPRP